MTAGARAAWPEERRFARVGRDRTQLYFDQRREEALDALAHPRVGDAGTLAVANWLRRQRDARSRLPDRNNIGEALVLALELAGLPADAASLREEGASRGGLDDVSRAEAALAARAALLLLQAETDEASWDLVSALRHRGSRLPPAVDQALREALEEEGFRERFLALAEELVSAAVASPTRGVLTGERETWSRLIEDWQREPNLRELWFGLRGMDYARYLGPEVEVLREVARLSPMRFTAMLERFDNPYQVWSALEATGGAASFQAWHALVEVAPLAFRPDGSWNGSVILPLLLVIAAQAVARGAAPVVRLETPEETRVASVDVTDAAEGVAAVLIARSDGSAAALRWAAWLARGMMSAAMDGPPVPNDARDRAFTPWQMLLALAQRAGANAWTSLSPGDLPDEELWFNLMAKVVSLPQEPTSATGYAELLDAFTVQWPTGDDPEAWHGEAGDRLRATSRVVRTFARQPTTLGVRILAIPLTMAPAPCATWADLWRRCLVLREVTEFAEPRLWSSSADDDTPQSATELTWLVLDLGLCVLEQVADERIAVPYDRGAVSGELVSLLWDGISEMLAIDRFAGGERDRARRHLVVRRAFFAADQDGMNGPQIIPGGARPSLAAMLRSMAAIERPFFSTLTALLDAGLPASTLLPALSDGSIDLASSLDAAERANAADERRPAIAPHALDRLRGILR